MRRRFAGPLESSMPRFLKPYRKQLKNFRTLARGYAQFATIKQWNCVDSSGAAIPWYSYPAIEFLGGLNFADLTVFEYGSGNSSVWWTQRARAVIAVESDQQWFDRTRAQIQSPNFRYFFHAAADYANSITGFRDKLDVIIVDGIQRVNCSRAAIAHIRQFGGRMLILDNADWHPNLVRLIQSELGWCRVDMHGFGPINDYTSTTTIWINQQDLGALYERAMSRPIGGLMDQVEEDREIGSGGRI